MAITNEATIRVRIDGADAEVSIKDLGKVIQDTMGKARIEADKARGAFSKLGDFSQKFFFTMRSFGMIYNTMRRLSHIAIEAAKRTGENTEQFQRFSKSIESLKVQGGVMLNTFLTPFMNLTSKLATWLGSLDQKLVMMIGSLGLATITIMKLIPVMRALGVTSRAAMGWIGVIITAVTFLYTAWTTNLWGLRTALSGFWEFLKMWADQIGTTLSALGKIIEGVLTFSGTKIKQGWNELKASFVDTWRAAFEKVKKDGETKLLPNLKPAFKLLGVEAAQEFLNSFKKELQAKLPNPYAEWAKLAKGKSAPELEKNPLEGKLPEPKKSVLWDYIEMLNEMGVTATNVFNTITNAIQQLSARIVDAMFDAKTKFKDIWIGIAKDFIKLFVDEILKTIAKKLVVKMIELLAIFDKASNDKMAIRIGQDYARLFTQGVLQGLNPQTLAINMAGVGSVRSNDSNIMSAINATNTKLAALANARPVVNNNISGRQLYDTVKWQRSRELMRRGRDVNNELF